MNLTKRRIRRLIRESILRESREAHVQGIADKIERLEQELVRQKNAMRKTYDDTRYDAEQLMPG